ncbi:MAG TPA: ROK family protein [Miltoncostaeaceae bacterium]|nr:ROK family protein [Miltoncostaeaceae bacterium]
MSAQRLAIGVDIGGTGIKVGLVDTVAGALVGERVRVLTPQPAVPSSVIDAARGLVGRFPAGLPVGVGIPGVIVDGRVLSAPHLDPEWIGFDAGEALVGAFGPTCTWLNDADAAGIAAKPVGAAEGYRRGVLEPTLGTGIGSALFVDGRLVPNTEFGHIEIRGKDGERRASAAARKRKGLTYERWAPLLNEYLNRIDALVWPDLIVLGGGISRQAERFVPLLDVRPPVVAAALMNRAGIGGAAVHAAERAGRPAAA